MFFLQVSAWLDLSYPLSFPLPSNMSSNCSTWNCTPSKKKNSLPASFPVCFSYQILTILFRILNILFRTRFKLAGFLFYHSLLCSWYLQHCLAHSSTHKC